ncbi:MAG TPA: S41 family peptidase [Candidatus Kapabacteria bacterium]|nr:S41 family peptidase [Candidatus Kapabacteria bacterium]HPP40406.1 S41 family peptidase [Candidatus Kapabacteria bacterium]HPU23128.1 S41 family peptidase [Candidatus Kapabacteria bacterium]
MKRVLIIILIIAAVININNNASANDVNNLIEYNAQKFKFILETAVKNHLDTFDIEQASESAFRAMLNFLDNQSNYYSAKQLKEYQEKNTGRAEGIGITAATINDSVVVGSVQKNSPAEKAGIKRGDILLFVDNQAVTGKSQQEVNELLAGDTGTVVNLILKNTIGELKNYVVGREIYKVSSIASSFYLKSRKIGYIASSRFTSYVYDDLTNEIDNFLKKGLECLIIDLRGNPGGFLDEVVKVTAEFLPKNSVIVYTNSKNNDFTMNFRTEKDGKYLKIPLILLVDGQTASAAEIFAGALQDHDRAIVLGENTFGKGTVQRLWTMRDGSGFRLTVAEYFSPIGRRIDKGILKKNMEKAELDESLKLSIGEEAFREISKAFEETGGATRLPTYTTKKGRTLISKGGVFPDELVRSDTLNLLSKVLMNKGILLEFTRKIYLSHFQKKMANEYKELENYLQNFNVDEQLYNDFYQFSLSKNIWNAEMAKIDEQNIKNLIKSYLALWHWDNSGFLATRIFDDKVLNKAISNSEKAKSLIN